MFQMIIMAMLLYIGFVAFPLIVLVAVSFLVWYAFLYIRRRKNTGN